MDRSLITVKIEKPAGMVPPAQHLEAQMATHLLLLLLIVVILDFEVKVIVRKR